jgi:predicted nucleic-acid-binding protein
MRVTLDTNALVRVVTTDDPAQTALVRQVIAQATLIAVTVPCLCELVWVLRTTYNFDRVRITEALKAFVDVGNIVLDRPTVEAGIRFLEGGGDFADGAIAFEGRALGGETFVSFDKKAVSLIERQGKSARLLQVARS